MDVYMDEIRQFKCLADLREIIKEIDGYYARPTEKGSHPTLYPEVLEGRYRTVMGIRVSDYKFSPDGLWVLPDDNMGLSFSTTWQHLKKVHKMFSRDAKKSIDVYWVLSEADIPKGLKFVADSRPSKSAKGHYLLTVTEKMKTSSLVEKLRWVADRMSIIRDGSRVL